MLAVSFRMGFCHAMICGNLAELYVRGTKPPKAAAGVQPTVLLETTENILKNTIIQVSQAFR